MSRMAGDIGDLVGGGVELGSRRASQNGQNSHQDANQGPNHRSPDEKKEPLEWDDERTARAALTAICEPGHPKLAGLVEVHGASATLEALRSNDDDSAWSRRAKKIDEQALIERAEQEHLRCLIPGDDQWPIQLDDLARGAEVQGLGGVPIGLWIAGQWSFAQWTNKSVGIVGARAATRYGEAVASELAAELSHDPDNYTVISGGAYGIDAAAHRGALAVQGRTIGLYAGGLDTPYPRGNARLFDELRAEHLVVSEAAPGIRTTRAGFLSRSRLIAALSSGTIVVEAAIRSGARNTATWANELGRVVMAVPGSVHSASSQGCHRLIRDGQATLVAQADDVRALLSPIGLGPELATYGPERILDTVDPRLVAIREAMPGRGGVSIGDLADACGQPLSRMVGALAELELLGLVRQDQMGEWHLKRPVHSAI